MYKNIDDQIVALQQRQVKNRNILPPNISTRNDEPDNMDEDDDDKTESDDDSPMKEKVTKKKGILTIFSDFIKYQIY